MISVQTVDENMKMFTERERELKNAAFLGQLKCCSRMGYPSMKDIVDGVNKGRVLPISKSDLDNAVRI